MASKKKSTLTPIKDRVDKSKLQPIKSKSGTSTGNLVPIKSKTSSPNSRLAPIKQKSGVATGMKTAQPRAAGKVVVGSSTARNTMKKKEYR